MIWRNRFGLFDGLGRQGEIALSEAEKATRQRRSIAGKRALLPCGFEPSCKPGGALQVGSLGRWPDQGMQSLRTGSGTLTAMPWRGVTQTREVSRNEGIPPWIPENSTRWHPLCNRAGHYACLATLLSSLEGPRRFLKVCADHRKELSRSGGFRLTRLLRFVARFRSFFSGLSLFLAS